MDRRIFATLDAVSYAALRDSLFPSHYPPLYFALFVMEAKMNPQPVDLLIKARWLIPVAPRDQVFENCAVAVDRSQIVAIVPNAEATIRFAAKQTVELDNHLLIPGLINAHGHAAMTLLRGYADDLPLDTWLKDHIWPVEGKWVNEQFVRDGTELAAIEMIRSGTTCFADMYFFPEAAAEVANRVGLRGQIAFPVLDFATPWAETADEYIHKGLALRDEQKGNDLLQIAFGPHAPYTVSDKPLQKIATYSEELAAPIHIHLHETANEVTDALAGQGKRPIERLRDLGLMSPLTQCVHMTQIVDTDLAILRDANAHVIHCPESNLKLASGFCPVQQLLDHGINVALGTDGAASNNDLNLFGEMQTAALLAKAVAGDASALNAHQALRLATLNGAKALGLADLTGSVEVGKAADLVAINLGEPETAPMYNPASQLVYTNNGHRVSDVWVNGKALLRNRQLLTLNQRETMEKARLWAQKIHDA